MKLPQVCSGGHAPANGTQVISASAARFNEKRSTRRRSTPRQALGLSFNLSPLDTTARNGRRLRRRMLYG